MTFHKAIFIRTWNIVNQQPRAKKLAHAVIKKVPRLKAILISIMQASDIQYLQQTPEDIVAQYTKVKYKDLSPKAATIYRQLKMAIDQQVIKKEGSECV